MANEKYALLDTDFISKMHLIRNGEYGFREESERKECHADDCSVFLCEDSL